MNNNLKKIIFLCLFLGVLVSLPLFVIASKQKADAFLDGLKVFEITQLDTLQEKLNMKMDITLFSTSENPDAPKDFVDVTLKNVSPLMCSQILRRDRPFNVDVYLNDKPVFFGSDWRCFKGLKHQMRFQFSFYNLSKRFQMDEPKACLDIWDCDVKNNETCTDGYCQKTLPPQHQSLTKK